MKLSRIFALCALLTVGCAFLQSAAAPSDAFLAGKDTICVIQHYKEPVPQIIKDCSLTSDAARIAVDIVNEQLAQAAAAEKAGAAHCASSSPADAGADAGDAGR